MDEKPIEPWKLVGGGLIVAIAFAIMMPGVLDYIGRIGRVLIMVLVAVAIALSFVMVRRKLASVKGKESESADAAQAAEPNEANAES